MFVYFFIVQIGYMILGFSMNTELGLMGSIVHLFNYVLIKGGLFLVVVCVVFCL